MQNPFRFSGIVSEPAFCDRLRERREMKQYIENAQNVLLYSHRRYGKSSLILKVFREVRNISTVYIDLYGTTHAGDFIAAFLKGISSLESQMSRLVKVLREGIRSVGLNFSVDPVTGMPTASPVISRPVQQKTIEELFAIVEKFSRRKKLAVAFDEFQEVAAYGGDAFEKTLRKAIQNHNRVAYIFAGSQMQLLTEMFNDRKRAFYMLAAHLPLGKIETAAYVRWVRRLYRKAGRSIERPLVEEVVAMCENHPMYVQEFFFNLWNETELSFEQLDRVQERMIEKRVPEYAYLWDPLSLNQKRALKLVALTDGKNLFAADNLDRTGFRTASQVTAALAGVKKAGILDKNKTWKIHDPFFKKWLMAAQR